MAATRKTIPKKEIKTHFRVAIYGSARIKKDDKIYKQVFQLARFIAGEGIDVVTGGGPGLMDAASRGHHVGRTAQKPVRSIGLTIHLPREQRDGFHLDVKREFYRFSQRLDSFIELSDAVVVASGGIGTLLELFYTWQLVQVKHICETPVILLGAHWQGLINWIQKEILAKKLMSPEDFDFIFVAKTNKEAIDIIKFMHANHNSGEHVCRNYKKYNKHRPLKSP